MDSRPTETNRGGTVAPSSQPVYTAYSVAMLRVPLRPLSDLPKFFEQAPDPSNLAERASYFLEFFADYTAESIKISSPPLYDALARMKRGEEVSDRRVRRALDSFQRYLIRMSSRPTPFGLFAGTSIAKLDERDNIILRDKHHFRTHTRPSAHWLWEIALRIERELIGANPVELMANNSAVFYNGRMYFPLNPSHSSIGTQGEVSIKVPQALHSLLTSRVRFTQSQLRRIINDATHNAPDHMVDSLIDQLMTAGVIYSQLRPNFVDGDPLEKMIEETKNTIKNTSSSIQILMNVESDIKLYDSYSVMCKADSPVNVRYIQEGMNEEIRDSAPLVHVDLELATESATLSRATVREAAKAMELLCRLSTIPAWNVALVAYRKEFVAYYGMGREVPILELLDERTGLGPPAGYRSPRRSYSSPLNTDQRPRNDLPRQRHLLRLITTAYRDGSSEIVLSDRDVDKLTVDPDWSQHLPPTAELFASLGRSATACDGSAPLDLIVGPSGGSGVAGQAFGRFFHSAEADVSSLLKAIAHDDQTHHEQAIAEIVQIPTSKKGGNPLVRRHYRSLELPVGCHSSLPAESTLDPRDLVVGVSPSGFYIYDCRREQEVLFRSSHRLNATGAPNLVRFLTEVSEDGYLYPTPFDWGTAGFLPAQPRLRYGHTILSPARWSLEQDALIECSQDYTRDGIRKAIQGFVQHYGVPRWVIQMESDVGLVLDLMDPTSIEFLANRIHTTGETGAHVFLYEMLPAPKNALVSGSDGETYASEIVIPLRLSSAQRIAGRRRDQLSRETIQPRQRQALPLGEWSSFKIYCPFAIHDSILIGQILPLMQTLTEDKLITEWFFVRYADPYPHLRLRLRPRSSLRPSEAVSTLSVLLHEMHQGGTIRSYVIDTYDREIERYGGGAGIELCESLFTRDSELVYDIMTQHQPKWSGIDEITVPLLTGLMFLQPLCNSRERMIECVSADIEDHPLDTRKWSHERRLARSYLLDPSAVESQHGYKEISSRWQAGAGSIVSELEDLECRHLLTASLPNIMSSAFHMHFNRLGVTDRSLETRVRSILLSALDGLVRNSGGSPGRPG